ncbi:hypothetical protein V6N13_142215 [Hibiscus sabdariffa]
MPWTIWQATSSSHAEVDSSGGGPSSPRLCEPSSTSSSRAEAAPGVVGPHSTVDASFMCQSPIALSGRDASVDQTANVGHSFESPIALEPLVASDN